MAHHHLSSPHQKSAHIFVIFILNVIREKLFIRHGSRILHAAKWVGSEVVNEVEFGGMKLFIKHGSSMLHLTKWVGFI